MDVFSNNTDSTAFSGPMSPFGSGTGPIHFDDLTCTGDEDSLFECPFADTHNCAHRKDAGIRCVPRRESIPNGCPD